MESTSSRASAQAAAGRSPLSGIHYPPLASPGQPKEVELKNRRWHVDALTEHVVQQCGFCFEGLACRHLCVERQHCVCVGCYDRMQSRRLERKCTICRTEGLSHAALERLDAQLQQALAVARLHCTECNDWSGAPDTIDEHIRLCGQKQHACPQQDYGCQWKGVRDELEAHQARCEWVPVPCSHAGCTETLLRGTQEEHEAACPHKPVSLGALATTQARLEQLQDLHQFCQQDASLLGGLAPSELQVRMEQTASLLPLLYQAVEGAVALDGAISCPWGCGLRTSSGQLDVHAAHCLRHPVECEFCPLKVARENWIGHMAACEERRVPCPRACEQSPVRAGDLDSGAHDRSCPEMLRSCQYCHTDMPMRELEAHQNGCRFHPVECGWCFESHDLAVFEQFPLPCRRDLPREIFTSDKRLVQAERASGAVYVDAQEIRKYNTVYVWLPAPLLRRELGPDATGRNLTSALSFVWQDCDDCKLEMRYLPQRRCFSVVLHTSIEYMRTTIQAILRNSDGVLIEEMGKLDSRFVPAIQLRLWNKESDEGYLKCINRIAEGRDSAFLLQLGPPIRR